ncbi:sure-like protein [Athelia psychrophila]|uniref:Sure-like protein n=1 Tax=Athelia psychrophila TaxID=1759441 RepID=A0A166RR90_9AGAM|nr:sure-like protein [Fibularhizoctonia sp. CBS 109695]
MRSQNLLAASLLTFVTIATATKILLTNDDGWAVAQIRAQNTALKKAGYEVLLSAPAENESGTGSSATVPFPPQSNLTIACEYDTCPIGSPPEGFNASDPFLNYVNGFPSDAARYGIQYLAPRLFRSKPDLVVSGPNIGNNLGTTTQISGTVGAATEAAILGIPSIAFSGDNTAQVSYTTLESDPTSTASVAAEIYAALTTKFAKALLDGAHGGAALPPNISINVNYPATIGATNCTAVGDYKFVLSRIYSNSSATVRTCGAALLPNETSVVATDGCYASVSVFATPSKLDADATAQAKVQKQLGSLLSCLPK